jgi:hypothetical protein
MQLLEEYSVRARRMSDLAKIYRRNQNDFYSLAAASWESPLEVVRK